MQKRTTPTPKRPSAISRRQSASPVSRCFPPQHMPDPVAVTGSRGCSRKAARDLERRISSEYQTDGGHHASDHGHFTTDWKPEQVSAKRTDSRGMGSHRTACPGSGRTQPHCAFTCSFDETVTCAFFDGRLHCRQARIQQCRISDLDYRNRLHHARLADSSIGSLQVAGLHCIQGVFETVANVHFKQGFGLARIPCKSGIERIPVFLHLGLRQPLDSRVFRFPR